MLIVKMMSDQPMSDDDQAKRFRLITGVVDVRFDQEDAGYVMRVWYRKEENPNLARPESFCVAGMVYVMNETGRTISSFYPMLGAPGGPVGLGAA